jgi:hypothetical protein
MKNIIRYLLIVVFLVLLLPVTYFVMETSGATIDTPQNKVIYTMPYPGILPDHPLYFIKIIRDRINEFMTRDQLKKAEIYLLYSDKRAAMAMALAQKGKNKLAIETFSKGEKYFLNIPTLLMSAKKQGSSAPSSFVETAKLANAKHKELIDELIKTFPQGLNEPLTSLSLLNDEVRHGLESL